MPKPGLIERARAALKFFRYGYQGASEKKQKGLFLWPAWRQGKPEWQLVDMTSYVNDGFNINALIYSAIMYKGRSAAAARLRAYTGDPEKPELLQPNHPLAKLVSRPNQSQSWREFITLQEIYLNVSGNAYTYFKRPVRGGLPTEMIPLRPDRVYIVPKDGQLLGYTYVPEGKSSYDGEPILPQDISHVKFPNPGDPLEFHGYGLSPMSPMAKSGDVDNMVTDFLNLYFRSGTMLNTYITFDAPMDGGVLAEVRDKFMDIYGGSENWHKVAAFDSGGKVERFGWTFEEMGFETIDERNEARILGPLGVPMTLLGTRSGMKAATYNNKKQDREMFWEDTMVPEMSLFEDDYQYYLQTDDGGFVMYDYSSVPALRKEVPQLVDAAFKLWSMGETRNNAYAMAGLHAPGETPGGDVSYLPFSVVAQGATASAVPGTNDGAAEAEDDTRDEGKRKSLPNRTNARKSGFTPEQKAAHWKAVDKIATQWQNRFAAGARKAFETDKREILALLTGAKQKALARKATVDWTAYEDDALEYLSNAGAENWRSTFIPLLRGVMTDQGERWASVLGMEFDVQNLYARDWFNKYTLKFAQPIVQTTKDVISQVLDMAQADGWSIPTMQGHLETVFQQMMTGDVPPDEMTWYTDRLPPYRTEMIARTETIRASNAGSEEIFKEFGVKRHEWLSTKDDRTRPDHADADGQVVDIGEPFDVGGEKLMYPGDPNGSPESTIQCRCTTLPILENI